MKEEPVAFMTLKYHYMTPDEVRRKECDLKWKTEPSIVIRSKEVHGGALFSCQGCEFIIDGSKYNRLPFRYVGDKSESYGSEECICGLTSSHLQKGDRCANHSFEFQVRIHVSFM